MYTGFWIEGSSIYGIARDAILDEKKLPDNIECKRSDQATSIDYSNDLEVERQYQQLD